MKPTQEQVIVWAREVDLLTTTELNGYQVWIPENLERFANLAYEVGRKDENEAIADAVSKCDARATPKGIAAAIRERGAP